MQKILFVCTGNTCRSAMAAALFRRLLQEHGLAGEYLIGSAGVAAWPGQPASPEAIDVLAERGVDLSGHLSCPLSPELLAEADLVLGMTPGHKQAAQALCPEMAEKIFTLRELAGLSADVSDPYGLGMGAYRDCADQLEKALPRLLENLQQNKGKREKI